MRLIAELTSCERPQNRPRFSGVRHREKEGYIVKKKKKNREKRPKNVLAALHRMPMPRRFQGEWDPREATTPLRMRMRSEKQRN